MSPKVSPHNPPSASQNSKGPSSPPSGSQRKRGHKAHRSSNKTNGSMHGDHNPSKHDRADNTRAGAGAAVELEEIGGGIQTNTKRLRSDTGKRAADGNKKEKKERKMVEDEHERVRTLGEGSNRHQVSRKRDEWALHAGAVNGGTGPAGQPSNDADNAGNFAEAHHALRCTLLSDDSAEEAHEDHDDDREDAGRKNAEGNIRHGRNQTEDAIGNNQAEVPAWPENVDGHRHQMHLRLQTGRISNERDEVREGNPFAQLERNFIEIATCWALPLLRPTPGPPPGGHSAVGVRREAERSDQGEGRESADSDLDFETAIAILVSSFPNLQPDVAGSYLVRQWEDNIPLSVALELTVQYFRLNTKQSHPSQQADAGGFSGGPSARSLPNATILPSVPAPRVAAAGRANGYAPAFMPPTVSMPATIPAPVPAHVPLAQGVASAQGWHQPSAGPSASGAGQFKESNQTGGLHGKGEACTAGPPSSRHDEDVEYDPFECKRLEGLQWPEYSAYQGMCIYKLSVEFPRVSLTDLRRALSAHKDRIGPTHRTLKEEYAKAMAHRVDSRISRAGMARGGGEGGAANAKLKEVVQDLKGKAPAVEAAETSEVAGTAGSSSVPLKSWAPKGLSILVRPRPAPRLPMAESPLFDKEWAAVERAYARLQEKRDEEMARKLNEAEYEEEGQRIECGCCYGDYPFEEMVQCADGHLFCYGCLQRRVEESTFGGLQACGSLPCMDTEGCTESFPPSEVRRALPPQIMEKYEQRQADDSVARAELEGLVFCPSCNCPVEMDANQTVLNCPNEACGKASCRLCREPRHDGLRCDQVEKKDETDVRKRVEEIMSKALIRECTKCRAELVKSDGCNKVICRCGQAMCYVCRKAIPPDYTHFCQHLRNPGQACTTCNACSLWIQEDEEEVLKKAREEAINSLPPELREQALSLFKRPIGPNEAASKQSSRRIT